MAVTIRVKTNRLPAIARQLPIAATAIIGKRGEEMVQIARQESRVDTGQMRDGWRFQTRGTAPGGALTNDVEHTPFHEYGTRFVAPQPMARPAAEQVFPRIVEDFRDLESAL